MRAAHIPLTSQRAAKAEFICHCPFPATEGACELFVPATQEAGALSGFSSGKRKKSTVRLGESGLNLSA